MGMGDDLIVSGDPVCSLLRAEVPNFGQLAGCTLTVVETTHARHAQELAASINLTECADGTIIHSTLKSHG